MRLRLATVALAGLLAIASNAIAATIQVSPVLIDVPPPGAASKVQISNLSDQAVVAQVRIFKWTQENGADKLVETKDVAVSPPVAKLKPNAKAVLRVVRRAKTAPQGEESYRIIIDQIPEKRRSSGSGIVFTMRYSIPVFFGGLNDEDSAIVWDVATSNGQTIVTATNTGTRRVRIADMTLQAGSSKVQFSNGLVGYVLPGSTIKWTANGRLKGVKQGGKVAITAQTEHGPLQATGTIQAAQ